MSPLLLVTGLLGLPFLAGIFHSAYSPSPYRFGTQNSYYSYAAFGLLHLLVAHLAGIPDEVEDMQPAVAASFLAGTLTTGAWAAIQIALPGLLPRRVVFTCGALAAGWSFLCCFLSVRGKRRETQRERVSAVLTEAESGVFSADAASEFPLPEIGFTVTTIIELDELLGATSSRYIESMLNLDAPTTLIVTDDAATLPLVLDAATAMHRRGVKVRTVGAFYDEYFGKIALHDLTRMAMLFDVRTMLHAPYRRMKRTIDFVGAVIAAIACLIISPLIIAGNFAANRGPLLFRQPRVGLNGKEFIMLKFRTMNPSFEETLEWTSPEDPRITRFGRILRKSHIDELPQFWNILRGEISLVGPRPEQPHYVEALKAKEPAYELRHLVTPGLTGWAQIKFRYAATEAQAIEKLQYDLYYLQHQSLSLDLRILSRTLRSVIRRQGH